MRVIRRHYRVSSVTYGWTTWSSGSYRAFDFYWGKHVFVLGFEGKSR